ncbi:DUF3883 domain-containing protein [Brevundimonas sp. TWP3-1-2b1]|uniref:DUF3883 domain-containing protein n=1 Tax=Brevundimonas sp. TWP3-1-2b1 TaxID=2804650 RepID=UPI003CEC544A
MNAARPADGLLPARLTLALLALIGLRAEGCTEERALADLTAVASASRSRARNTIALLSRFGLLKAADQTRITVGVAERHFQSSIASATAALLADRIEVVGPRCLQARGDDGIWLDSRLLPGSEDGLLLWLLEFNVASRSSAKERYWRVTPSHSDVFLRAARAANQQAVRRPMTPAQLEAALAAQAEHGLEAELWVLAHERRRLKDHLLFDQVRRVSEENVSAGYDIASFSGSTVLHHDLHIEVKSFAGEKRFFWTRNEINVAAALGEAYALYLVDRRRMAEADYRPEIIPGPYSALFLSSPPSWDVSPTTYECRALG